MIENKRLSTNFNLYEFLHSDTANAQGGAMWDDQYAPNDQILENHRANMLGQVYSTATFATPSYTDSWGATSYR